jgi:hypothetical protein
MILKPDFTKSYSTQLIILTKTLLYLCSFTQPQQFNILSASMCKMENIESYRISDLHYPLFWLLFAAAIPEWEHPCPVHPDGCEGRAGQEEEQDHLPPDHHGRHAGHPLPHARYVWVGRPCG